MKRRAIEYKRGKRRLKYGLDTDGLDYYVKPVYDLYVLGLDETAQMSFKMIDRNLFYMFNRLKRKMK